MEGKMPKIFAVHKTGFRIELDDIDRTRLDEAIAWLIAHDYRPDGSGDQWPKTPSGLPICTKHNTEMRQRQKQNDSWYSHRVIHPETGQELFCKGFPNPTSAVDGFHV
jgi:hypothetical protein